MSRSLHPQSPPFVKRCQTCGRVLEKNLLRYCSSVCKSRFQFKLKWFNNLLRAMSAKYASFSFSEDFLILNILPQNSVKVYTYFHRRCLGKKPSQDMSSMVFDLGKLWWDAIDTHQNRKKATQMVLEQGQTEIFSLDWITPVEKVQFANISKQLFVLEVNAAGQPEQLSKEAVKAAFRKAAKRHHPDLGGDTERFQKAYQAYEELIAWLNQPQIKIRRGIPGQWCYLGWNNAWLKPL